MNGIHENGIGWPCPPQARAEIEMHYFDRLPVTLRRAMTDLDRDLAAASVLEEWQRAERRGEEADDFAARLGRW